MTSTFKLAAAITFTGLCFTANAQTKPMPKGGKMETKSEEKMETKKMEMKEDKMEVKGGKTMHHGKMQHGKMATKSQM